MQENNKDFLIKIITITVSILIIIFFINLWIIKPLVEISKEEKKYENKFENKKIWHEKEKIKIKWQDAIKYEGKYVITEGIIVSSYNNGKICFLNFDRDYKKNLTLVIFSSSFKRFPENPEKYYLGKKIRVEGRIKIYKEKPEIILESADQIIEIK